MENLSILEKNKKTFSILHTHFYKTPTSVCLFYHLFYLNNNISLIFYYIKQTTTHMAPPTYFFLFLMPTLSFSLNRLPLSCSLFPSSFFSLFFLLVLQQIFETPSNLTAAIITPPPTTQASPVTATHHCYLRS